MYLARTYVFYLRNDAIAKSQPNKNRRPNSDSKLTVTQTEQAGLQSALHKLTDWLEAQTLLALAKQSGFSRRIARKLTPLLFVQASVLLVSQSAVSLRRWAVLAGLVGQMCLSKQALWERLTTRAVEFLRSVLALLLARQLELQPNRPPAALASFGRVLVQDSTSVKLSPNLAAAFPGARNQRPAKSAHLKVQAIYDLLAQRFVTFSLSSFRRNDQAAAQDVLALVRAADLVVRDLGYFVVENLRQIAQADAFFLSRLRLDTGLYDPRTGQPLDLAAILKRQGSFDDQVLLGQSRLPVRLVALKLSEAVAAARRRKAKQNRDRRCRPSARHLTLLGWAIFVTNVPPEVWSAKTVAEVYGLRWRIETIFKAWKSHFRLTTVPRGAAAQLEAMIYARLIFITVFVPMFAVPEDLLWQTKSPPPLSLLKLAGLIGDWLLSLCLEAWQCRITDNWLRQLDYHGRYERRTRKPFPVKLMKLS